MNNQRVELLIAYLQALCDASKAGVTVYKELRRVIAEIEEELSEGESEK